MTARAILTPEPRFFFSGARKLFWSLMEDSSSMRGMRIVPPSRHEGSGAE